MCCLYAVYVSTFPKLTSRLKIHQRVCLNLSAVFSTEVFFPLIETKVHCCSKEYMSIRTTGALIATLLCEKVVLAG